MAAIINMSQNEWMKLFLCKMAESKMVEFKMAAIIRLSENEWVKFFIVQNGWIQDGRIQDGWHHQVKKRMNDFESDWICLSQSFVQNGLIQDGRIQHGRIQDGCHHHINQNELVWCSILYKMTESKMAEYKMAAINRLIRLNKVESESECS